MKQPLFGHSHSKVAHRIERWLAQRPFPPSNRLARKTRRVLEILYRAVKKFLQIDGIAWAGAFAFNAFFSLFPLIILFVTIASYFIDRDRAGTEIIGYVEKYVPISGEMQRSIFDTIAGVIICAQEGGYGRPAPPYLGGHSMLHHAHQRNQPGLGRRDVQLVAAADDKPGPVRHHGCCNTPGG